RLRGGPARGHVKHLVPRAAELLRVLLRTGFREIAERLHREVVLVLATRLLRDQILVNRRCHLPIQVPIVVDEELELSGAVSVDHVWTRESYKIALFGATKRPHTRLVYSPPIPSSLLGSSTSDGSPLCQPGKPTKTCTIEIPSAGTMCDG